jgi:hypothetical protein
MLSPWFSHSFGMVSHKDDMAGLPHLTLLPSSLNLAVYCLGPKLLPTLPGKYVSLGRICDCAPGDSLNTAPANSFSCQVNSSFIVIATHNGYSYFAIYGRNIKKTTTHTLIYHTGSHTPFSIAAGCL